MSKIGIFLGFQYKSKIKSEGIGRLLGFMLKTDAQQNIVVAMPEWLKKEFMALLEDQDISPDKIEIITTKKVPYSIRVMEFYKKLKLKKKTVKKNKVQRIIDWVSERLKFKINNLISSKNISYIVFTALYLTIIAILLLPLVLVGYILIQLKRIVKRINNVIIQNSKRLVKKIIREIYSLDDFGKVIHMLYEKMHHVELKSLVQDINKRQDIETWYIPALFWPEVQEIKAKKIIAAPDIVYYDFPVQFATPSDDLIHNKLIKTIKSADHIICYSNYVKYNHIVKKFSIDEQHITVIPHGCIEMDKLIKVKNSIKRFINQKQLAVEIIEQYILANGVTKEILRNVDWYQMRFITYSSQDRPHKNILALIKAVEILNRERYQNIKLVLTGNIYENNDIVDFIKENNMENEIIQFYNVPSKVLAAFNKLAICAVNPTMFEGGFPFTFTEAYSMNTPSVMSKIPVIEEVIQDEELRDKMLFDPYDLDDMVEKINWAIENHEVLYDMQADLYAKFKERNWNSVVEEYIALFNTI